MKSIRPLILLTPLGGSAQRGQKADPVRAAPKALVVVSAQPRRIALGRPLNLLRDLWGVADGPSPVSTYWHLL
jgi:hypothetical protein